MAQIKADPCASDGEGKCAIEGIAVKGEGYINFMIEMFQWGCRKFSEDPNYGEEKFKFLMSKIGDKPVSLFSDS